MKTLIQLSAVVFGMLFASNLSAQCCGTGCGTATNCAAPAACPCDQALNDCWCLWVHYEPNYYTCPRCVEQTIPCSRTECRYVTRTYDVQRCRYVPEYFTETYSYQEPEYYQVPDCKVGYHWEYDQYVEYIPSYFWKHTCGNNCHTVPCK